MSVVNTASQVLTKRNAPLMQALNARPTSVRVAVYLIVAITVIFMAFGGYRYLVGAMPLVQLNANLLVLSMTLFLPWRVWLACNYSRIIYLALTLTAIGQSLAPLLLGVFPDDFLLHLFMLLTIPMQLVSVWFLHSATTDAWFTMVKNARGAA